MIRPGSATWQRTLGTTGLTVPAVTVGGSELGSMPETVGRQVSYEAGVALASYVLESPIQALDTSNAYGNGESERRIGAAIARRGGLPSGFFLTTKVDARGRDYSGARVRASLAESKERLGLDWLPLVYLHDPEFHDFSELSAPGGAVDTLMALHEEGEIGHVGLAGGSAPDMQRYLALGGFEVLLVHNRWTLLDHSAEELISQAEAQNVAIVNAAIYGGGILAKPEQTTKYAYREARPATLEAVRAMHQLCLEYGTSLAAAALQASVQDSRVSTTVVGLSSPSRVDSLIESLNDEISGDLFVELERLRPPRKEWLDFAVD
jgi:D-threo-aldose 1-dehydrogenase